MCEDWEDEIGFLGSGKVLIWNVFTLVYSSKAFTS